MTVKFVCSGTNTDKLVLTHYFLSFIMGHKVGDVVCSGNIKKDTYQIITTSD